jgi:hypothetical protein
VSGWTDTALRRLAWVGWWVTLAAATTQWVVTSLGDPDTPASWGSSTLGEYGFAVVVLSFPLVGLGILVRQPRNRIGWLLSGVGLAWTLPGLVDAYAHWGLVVDPGSLPGSEVAAAINEGTWVFGILAMGVYLVLLFPDGHLPSPQWRWVAWVAGAAALVVPLGIALSPGGLEEAPVVGLVNPLATEELTPYALALTAVGLPLVPLCIVAAAVSLALRFRRSAGTERQQITWLATAGALVAALFAVTLGVTLVAEIAAGGGSGPGRLAAIASVLQEASILSFLLLPLAIGAAILRYRLFDIDLVVNRALVYGSLTALLAGVYLGSVLLLQLLLQPLTEQSDLAVAVSTLAVAAAFRPARRRIQAAVDRRFYRRRYDAAQTLAAFTGRLRHRVDLDAVGAELTQAVRETVEPSHVSVWMPGRRDPA